MKAQTSSQAITAINRIKSERSIAVQQGWREDVAVLNEELEELRLALLKLRWKETTNGRRP